MKWLLRSASILALAFVSCSTTNNPVTNIYVVDSLAPTITRFSPDTVWTLGTLTIYGKHFGYGDEFVAIDTAQANIQSAYDTMITVSVPENAQTGPIRVATINGSTTSAKPVVVDYTFHPHTINDSLPVGVSFSIPGTGMNHYHGQLSLMDSAVGLFPILFTIDSVFGNRIVSHVAANALSGSIYLNSSGRSYPVGALTVTRSSSWKTLSIIWDHLTMTETHTRTGYVNGPGNPIDSTWKTTATYLGQQDVNVSGVPFDRAIPGELQYSIAVPDLQINWDTVFQTAGISFAQNSYSETATHTMDTEWYCESIGNLPAMLPVTNAIEFTLASFGYQISEDSTDTQGLVNWHETTTSASNSGSFNLILKP